MFVWVEAGRPVVIGGVFSNPENDRRAIMHEFHAAGWHSTPLTLFGEMKEVLMRLSFTATPGFVTRKVGRIAHPKGLGQVASRLPGSRRTVERRVFEDRAAVAVRRRGMVGHRIPRGLSVDAPVAVIHRAVVGVVARVDAGRTVSHGAEDRAVPVSPAARTGHLVSGVPEDSAEVDRRVGGGDSHRFAVPDGTGAGRLLAGRRVRDVCRRWQPRRFAAHGRARSRTRTPTPRRGNGRSGRGSRRGRTAAARLAPPAIRARPTRPRCG